MSGGASTHKYEPGITSSNIDYSVIVYEISTTFVRMLLVLPGPNTTYWNLT